MTIKQERIIDIIEAGWAFREAYKTCKELYQRLDLQVRSGETDLQTAWGLIGGAIHFNAPSEEHTGTLFAEKRHYQLMAKRNLRERERQSHKRLQAKSEAYAAETTVPAKRPSNNPTGGAKSIQAPISTEEHYSPPPPTPYTPPPNQPPSPFGDLPYEETTIEVRQPDGRIRIFPADRALAAAAAEREAKMTGRPVAAPTEEQFAAWDRRHGRASSTSPSAIGTVSGNTVSLSAKPHHDTVSVTIELDPRTSAPPPEAGEDLF